MSDWDSSNENIGVVYLAFGYEYLLLALNSIRTLKRLHPELSVSLITNMRIKNITISDLNRKRTNNAEKVFDEVIYVDSPSNNNRHYKTSINEYTPYEKTLFLDCDTEINRDIIQGFQFLNYFDIALVSRPIPSRAMANRWSGDPHIENIGIEDTSTFYGGVFFFERDKCDNFFNEWTSSYDEFGYSQDQFSLLHSIYNTSVRVLPLPVIWNTMDSDVERYENYYNSYDFKEEIKIRHRNRPSIKRMKSLRNLENRIGDKILDTNKREERSIRKKFRKNCNYKRAIKGELGKYLLAKKLYQKLHQYI